MASQTTPSHGLAQAPGWLPSCDDIPVLYEDEDEGDMGESNPHVMTDEILHVGLSAHFAGRPQYRVFSNMNLDYLKGPPHERTGSLPYVSPDLMIVVPNQDLGEEVASYTIGEDGPAPEATGEILSKRSAQQRDLKEKIIVYQKLGIAEYFLVDPTAKFLPERLLMKRLQANGVYLDEQDADGGITSRLGFRLILDQDGVLRVLDAATGKRYVRPHEAQAEADARRHAEEQLRILKDELARLKGGDRPA